MSDSKEAHAWLEKHEIKYVELIVTDMAGIPRGKVTPVKDFDTKKFKLPISNFGQTITGDYYMPDDNVADRDMEIRPNLATLRLVPWADEPTASVMVDCFDLEGNPVTESPRLVLQTLLERYQKKGWHPVVAPEVEFYLVKSSCKKGQEIDVFDPESEEFEHLVDPYGFSKVQGFGLLFKQLSEYCDAQGIGIGSVSQELGPSQFEVNFDHGEPLKLADDVFHFKRTLKRVAQEHGVVATFLAKPNAEQAGSSLHIHQSVYDADKKNIFSDEAGEPTQLFDYYIGGLQKFMPAMLLMFAPYENSYRRFLSHFSSPINLEWGIDNRTTGLRVPESSANARRVENRLAGSDVNPYLAIAGSIGCGYLGMTMETGARPAVQESAYDVPFALCRHIIEAIDMFAASSELRQLFGDEFITAYSELKKMESVEFQQRIPEWERGTLLSAI